MVLPHLLPSEVTNLWGGRPQTSFLISKKFHIHLLFLQLFFTFLFGAYWQLPVFIGALPFKLLLACVFFVRKSLCDFTLENRFFKGFHFQSKTVKKISKIMFHNLPRESWCFITGIFQLDNMRLREKEAWKFEAAQEKNIGQKYQLHLARTRIVATVIKVKSLPSCSQ